MRSWVATKDAQELFFTAQERHLPYGWVLPIERLADNPQLEGRQWWRDYQMGSETVRGPGAPYAFSETPWSVEGSVEGGASPMFQATDAVPPDDLLAELGW